MKKQIEEMAKVIKSSLDGLGCGNFNFTGEEISTMFAKDLYNAGYRKQSEMEWLFDDGMDRYCSNCGANALTSCFEYKQICTPYCPFCGAKMKGGAE